MMTVLRFAIGSVFLWFGVDKWIHPAVWYGWIPTWLIAMLPKDGGLDSFIYVNGIFECVVGIALVANRFVREAAACAGIFLLAITLVAGVNEVTIRDNALLGACLVLFVSANARVTRRVSQETITTICAFYVFYLFVYGVLYLRIAS